MHHRRSKREREKKNSHVSATIFWLHCWMEEREKKSFFLLRHILKDHLTCTYVIDKWKIVHHSFRVAKDFLLLRGPAHNSILWHAWLFSACNAELRKSSFNEILHVPPKTSLSGFGNSPRMRMSEEKKRKKKAPKREFEKKRNSSLKPWKKFSRMFSFLFLLPKKREKQWWNFWYRFSSEHYAEWYFVRGFAINVFSYRMWTGEEKKEKAPKKWVWK